MKRIIMAVVVVCLFGCTAFAEEANTATSVNIPILGTTDITSFIKLARVGVAYNVGDTDKYTDAHLSLVSFHLSDGVELINVNAGAIWRTSDGNSGGKIAIGIRPENLLKLLCSGTWATTHTTTTTLSNVEFNIGPSFIALEGYKSKVAINFGVAVGF